MSDSVWPQRRQPTRLPHPWDSPGKNTGVGCYFLLQCIKVKSESENRLVLSNSLQPHGLYSPWNSPGQNTGVGSLSLLQRIFPTQESNWGFLPCRWILYQLSYKGSPRISLKLTVYFSKPRCIFFNIYRNLQLPKFHQLKTEWEITKYICLCQDLDGQPWFANQMNSQEISIWKKEKHA